MSVLAEPLAVSGGKLLGRWTDLATRAGSALVLAPLVLLCCWRGGLAWLALLAIGFVLALLEWRLMARAGGIPPLAQAAAIGYAALAVAALVWLRDGPTGMVLIIFLLAVVWATDIGAYLAGRFLGGARLAPSISPGKTWSGALGGLLAAAIAGALVIALDRHLLSAPAVLIAAAISIAAQLGDLAESAAKRACGVKDSGRLIPGHGGLLDRIDGLLAAAPLLAAIMLGIGAGIPPWR